MTATADERADVPYGTVLRPDDLRPGPLPRSRGPLSAFVTHALRQPAIARMGPAPRPAGDVLYGQDGALALYCLYELHYRGFAGVDERWEWAPALLALRHALEEVLERRVREEAASVPTPDCDSRDADAIPAALRAIIAAPSGPSLSRYLAEQGTLEQFREFAVHRSPLQLKEADPHSWAIPRLAGPAKAALVEIQADEYGNGVARDMHQNLFGVTMLGLGLDPGYGAYLDRVPGPTLAAVNLASFFGLHRRLRGALVGHLAVFEMTSVEPMAAYGAALRRHGLSAGTGHFFAVHVVADAHHQTLASQALAGSLVRAEPELGADVLFGARAMMAVEGHCSQQILSAWQRGHSSLLLAPGPQRPRSELFD
ncbi:Iron-containing redox enzyme [Frankia sp. AiPs1]|uniref:iron-containing redox enzyme family protein n=1 Tax=Frankia sp. AiPa1 TaxID=573492 RepID=UPI00202B2DF0|nr:iron-containing redox enzyme family protein [Frankia sp. AiPa1]MCL9762727.1 iron-containing redox enzyme family protein [Frankia sp. AiPa1]